MSAGHEEGGGNRAIYHSHHHHAHKDLNVSWPGQNIFVTFALFIFI